MSKLFTFVLILLALAVLRSNSGLTPVQAESSFSHFWVEPGVTSIRAPGGESRSQGKVVIDMRTGDIWGFPTLAPMPYPVGTTSQTPPVSKPIYLGKFDFAAAKR